MEETTVLYSAVLVCTVGMAYKTKEFVPLYRREGTRMSSLKEVYPGTPEVLIHYNS